MIYLDNAATTKPKEEVVKAIVDCLENNWGNPSSLYSFGVSAKNIVDTSRKTIADFIGAKSSEIIFTSGACEANSLAINGFLKAHKYKFITTTIEHKSIINNFEALNIDKCMIPVDINGFVDMEYLEKALSTSNHKCLVSIQWANNEIGTIQDMKKISRLVHKYDGVLHTDATQLIPDIPIKVNDYDIDMLSFSGQKLGATKGIGVLFKRDETTIDPIIYGSQEKTLRGGTENVPYIVGLKAAIDNIYYGNGQLTKEFIEEVTSEIDDCYLVGSSNKRLKNNASICFKGIESESVLLMLDQKNICVSSGSACNSASLKPSYVLESIGLSKKDINSVVRFTFSEDTTYDEMEIAIANIKKVISLLKKMNE